MRIFRGFLNTELVSTFAASADLENIHGLFFIYCSFYLIFCYMNRHRAYRADRAYTKVKTERKRKFLRRKRKEEKKLSFLENKIKKPVTRKKEK